MPDFSYYSYLTCLFNRNSNRNGHTNSVSALDYLRREVSSLVRLLLMPFGEVTRTVLFPNRGNNHHATGVHNSEQQI